MRSFPGQFRRQRVFANGTGSPAWAKAASVDTLNSAIGGDFPPASPADIKNLDPVTGAYK